MEKEGEREGGRKGGREGGRKEGRKGGRKEDREREFIPFSYFQLFLQHYLISSDSATGHVILFDECWLRMTTSQKLK